MKNSYCIFIFLVVIQNIAFAQIQEYLHFSKDTSLIRNKDCYCFNNFQYYYDLMEKGNDQYDKLYKGIKLSIYEGRTVGYMLEELSRAYEFIDTTVINDPFHDPLKDSLHIYLHGIRINMYLNENEYLHLSIFLNDNKRFFTTNYKNDLVRILSEKDYCAYIIKSNIVKDIEQLDNMLSMLQENDLLQLLRKSQENKGNIEAVESVLTTSSQDDQLQLLRQFRHTVGSIYELDSSLTANDQDDLVHLLHKLRDSVGNNNELDSLLSLDHPSPSWKRELKRLLELQKKINAITERKEKEKKRQVK